MSKRLTSWQKATALVPLALLSGAWTASLAGTTTATAATQEAPRLPDGTAIPTQAIEAPASVSEPGEIAPGVPSGAADAVLASASTNGIPDAALAAYQRAAQVIDAADPSCHLSWPLIAAIGRVESNHGRHGGNTLGTDGVRSPGIFGIPLDGSNGTARITDTDAGQYDDDPVYDRAVGPMQFIPSTWSVVGVDGDGDGIRDPQDIDDAALATAVYLCSGDEDLATTAGQRAAVYRYNHSQAYVDLVLAIMRAYAAGDYTAVPNATAATTTFSPSFGGSTATPRNPKARPHQHKAQHDKRGEPSKAGGPTGDGSTGGGVTTPGGDSGAPALPGTDGPSDDPVKKVTDGATKAVEPVQNIAISTAQAVELCRTELQAQFGAAPQEAVTKCAAALQGKTLTEARAAVPGIVKGLADLVGDLLGGLEGGLGGLTGGLTAGSGGLLGGN
jgi:membrane-bound lytic murein transglycosylase B